MILNLDKDFQPFGKGIDFKDFVAVYKNGHGYECKQEATWEEVNNCELQTVFRDGKLLVDQTLSEIRNRLNNG